MTVFMLYLIHLILPGEPTDGDGVPQLRGRQVQQEPRHRRIRGPGWKSNFPCDHP